VVGVLDLELGSCLEFNHGRPSIDLIGDVLHSGWLGHAIFDKANVSSLCPTATSQYFHMRVLLLQIVHVHSLLCIVLPPVAPESVACHRQVLCTEIDGLHNRVLWEFGSVNSWVKEGILGLLWIDVKIALLNLHELGMQLLYGA